MLTKRDLLLAANGMALAGLGIGSGLAQDYPSRAIRLIIPLPPGGGYEFIIRLLADRLQSKLGHPVIVENRAGGAGGTVGAAAVAKAEPDGYTLLATPPGPLVTAASLYKDLGYDPARGFAPIAFLFSSPQLLAVNPAVPAGSVHELIAYAKANPRKISFANPGYGTQPHLLAEMFSATAGIEVVHVPYKGAAPAIADLVAGQVQAYFESSQVILPQGQAGKIRILAVANESRIAQLPQVPTTIEDGYPSIAASFWTGIVAPAGTPSAIIDRLNKTINEVMQTAEAQDALARLSATSRPGPPQAFADFITAETQKWSAVIQSAHLKID
jgi:tripartite-type tricarboxylate transporter receptor subunit TctC